MNFKCYSIFILFLSLFISCQPNIVNLQEVELAGPSIKNVVKIVEPIENKNVDINMNFSVYNKRNYETNLDGHTKVNEYNNYEIQSVENAEYYLENYNINIFDYEGKNFHWKIPSLNGSLEMDYKFSKQFAFDIGASLANYNGNNFLGYKLGFAFYNNFDELGIRFDAFVKNQEMFYKVQYIKVEEFNLSKSNTRKVYVFEEERNDNYYNMGYMFSLNTKFENWLVNIFVNYSFGWQTFYEISPQSIYTDIIVGDFNFEQYYSSFSVGLFQDAFSFGRIILGYNYTNYNRGNRNFLLPSAFLQLDFNLLNY